MSSTDTLNLLFILSGSQLLSNYLNITLTTGY